MANGSTEQLGDRQANGGLAGCGDRGVGERTLGALPAAGIGDGRGASEQLRQPSFAAFGGFAFDGEHEPEGREVLHGLEDFVRIGRNGYRAQNAWQAGGHGLISL